MAAMEAEALGAAGLAGLAEVTEAEIGRMVDLGVLVPREGPAPFRVRDVAKVRLAMACERAGLPMDAIADLIRAGRLSFAFMEAAPYHRFAIPSTRTLRQVGQDTGIPLEALRETLESMGFAWTSADDPIREDELEVLPLIQLAISSGLLDPAWLTRVGRAYAEGMRLAAEVENEAYVARFEEPVLASGLGQRQAMERASEIAGEFVPLVDRALMAVYRRQQELIWTEHQVENIEAALEEAGALVRPERVPAMCFLDLAGFTRLTEERGDQAAAELATTLAVLVERLARGQRGTPVKWLGDGVMLHYREPAGAVESALGMVRRVPEAGLPRPTWAWPPDRGSSRAATTSAAPSTWPPGWPPAPRPARSSSPTRSPRPRPPTASPTATWVSSTSRASRPRSGSWRRGGPDPQPQARLR